MSDNGTAFTSEDFALFMSENGIKHITSAPKHPASNGFAERYVRTFKETMKKMVNEKGSLDTKLSRFLLSYRTTPQATTGKTPGELLLNRKLKTRLDPVNPFRQSTTRTHVEDKQLAQKKQHDSQAPLREFQVNDPVFVKNFSYGPRWLCGNVIQKSRPVSYVVQLTSAEVFRRHVDHIRLRSSPILHPIVQELPNDAKPTPVPRPSLPTPLSSEASTPVESEVANPSASQPAASETATSKPASPLRKSTRVMSTPAYLKDYVC